MLVDVLASEKIIQHLKVLMPMVQGLDSDDKQKAYVTFAWTFILEGDVEEALKLIDLLTPEYIKSTMLTQMESDSTFDNMVEVVANGLLSAKICTLSHNDLLVPGTYIAPVAYA